MAEFGAAATLELTVPDRELRDARQQIEDGLGDVEVGVSTPPSRRPPGGASAMADGGFDSIDTLLTAQLEQLEDIHDELEKLGASGGTGGGGGGGGGGAGGTILKGLGARSLLAGGTAIGGATALTAGGIMAAGATVGKGARNVMQGQFPDSYAPSSEGISGTSYAYSKEGGIGGSAEPVIKPDQIQQMFDGIDMGLESQKPEWVDSLDNFQLNEPKWVSNLDQELQVTEPAWVGNLGQQVQWPEPQWLQSLSGGSMELGDINLDIQPPQVDVSAGALERQFRQAFEDIQDQIIQDAIAELENRVPDLGGFT